MSDRVTSFINNADVKTKITLLKGKTTLFVREDCDVDEPIVIILDNKTALDVANWIINNVEVVEDEKR